MKIKSFLSILFFALILVSCGSNDPEKFIGSWSGDINCGGDMDAISMVVTLGTSDDQLLLQFEETPLINATIDGDNLTIEKTNIPDGGGFSTDLSGSGTLNANGELVMNFTVEYLEDGVIDFTESCTAVLTK